MGIGLRINRIYFCGDSDLDRDVMTSPPVFWALTGTYLSSRLLATTIVLTMPGKYDDGEGLISRIVHVECDACHITRHVSHHNNLIFITFFPDEVWGFM